MKYKIVVFGLFITCSYIVFGMDKNQISMDKVTQSFFEESELSKGIVGLPLDLQRIIIKEFNEKPKSFRLLYQKSSLDYKNKTLSVAFAPHGNQFATGGCDKKVRILNTTTWNCIHELEHNNHVRLVKFSPQGNQLVTVCYDGKVCIFNTTTWNCIRELEDNHNKDICKTATGDHISHVNLYNRVFFKCITFSPTGSQLAIICDGKVSIFDTTTWNYIQESNDGIYAAFSINGRELATECNDKKVRICDTKTWNCISEVNGDSREIDIVEFSPHGNQLAAIYRHENIINILEWYAPESKQSILLRMIGVWLLTSKHSKNIDKSDLLLQDVTKTFFADKAQDVLPHVKESWDKLPAEVRNFLWEKSRKIIEKYGLENTKK